MAERTCKDCFHYKACKEGANRNGFWDIRYTEQECKHFLPTADVEEVKHGENISDIHSVDEFVCSECGIVLEGWTIIITDEDDGQLYYYEYEFKYCPNCGAKMDGGKAE